MDSFRTKAAALVVTVVGCACPAAAWAQNFPSKPIRFIAGGAGSSSDMRARQVAQKLKDSLGQPVVVDNRPGANGAIGARLAAKALPDGYTIFNCSSANMTNDLLNPDPSALLNKDLVAVTKLTSGWLILAVHPSVSATTLSGFIDLAKAKPGALSYGAAAQGSLSHLLGEWIKLKTGVNVRPISYKFTGAEVPDVLGGHIHATFAYFNVIGPYITAGKLKALAVAAPKRLQAAPEIVTMSEGGFPGMQANGWNGVCLPAGVPRPVFELLYREVVKALADPAIRDQIIATGADPGGERPEEFAAFIRSEIEKWGKVIKEAGIVIQ